MTTAIYKKSTKSGGVLATTLMALVMMLVMAVPAEAKSPKVSDILNNNGFSTLLFALDTAGLTSVLDENQVVVFAPTDDVFEATAVLLGCSSVLELATNLLNTPVGDSNALAVVLSYHAYLGRLKNDYALLNAGELLMANGDTVTTGVNQNGQSVKGIVNQTASTITTGAFKAKRGSSVYAIDQILLPIDPTGICAP
jgi:uncharacterized surface protein with fasciclin (FAS1) repeats